MHGETLAHLYFMAGFVIDKNTEGISNEEALVRPQPAGNSLNFVMGHLVYVYDQALELAGVGKRFPGKEMAPYAPRHSGPPDADAVPLDELIRRFHEQGKALAEAVKKLSPEDFARPLPSRPGVPGGSETVGSTLAAIAFHQAYHAGQTGLLRRLLGYPGAIAGPGEPPA